MIRKSNYIKYTLFRFTAAAFALVMSMSMLSCAADDDAPSTIPAETQGTFTDPRDGHQYTWVRYGGLDWMTENACFDIQDDVNSSIYLDADENGSVNGGYNPQSTRNLSTFGRLYTLAGAKLACPDGWRIPTDADWQALERSLGMTADEVAADGWRGHSAPFMLSIYGERQPLNLLLGGYYFGNSIQTGWRFLGALGYYWSATVDTAKGGEYYYVRKLSAARDGVCRLSMEPTGYKLSVRFVRDAQ